MGLLEKLSIMQFGLSFKLGEVAYTFFYLDFKCTKTVKS